MNVKEMYLISSTKSISNLLSMYRYWHLVFCLYHHLKSRSWGEKDRLNPNLSQPLTPERLRVWGCRRRIGGSDRSVLFVREESEEAEQEHGCNRQSRLAITQLCCSSHSECLIWNMDHHSLVISKRRREKKRSRWVRTTTRMLKKK